jgi:uncharacterized peroxidase-related enzyme
MGHRCQLPTPLLHRKRVIVSIKKRNLKGVFTMSTTARLDLPAQTIDGSEGTAKELLLKAKAQVGFVPNMYAKMANAPGVLETYLFGYQRFREASGFTPVEQEVILLTISRFHGCSYCMAAHSMIADKMSKVPADILEALRAGTAIPDPKLAALSDFTRVVVEQRGNPTPEQLSRFRDAGYTDRQVLEIILAIAVKTISNYCNHVLHTEVDPVFDKYKWEGK